MIAVRAGSLSAYRAGWLICRMRGGFFIIEFNRLAQISE
jgi:hypothetical protein